MKNKNEEYTSYNVAKNYFGPMLRILKIIGFSPFYNEDCSKCRYYKFTY